MLVSIRLADVYDFLQLFCHFFDCTYIIGMLDLLFYQFSSEQKIVLLKQNIVPFLPASLAHNLFDVEEDALFAERLSFCSGFILAPELFQT